MTFVLCHRVANHCTKLSQTRATSDYLFLSTDWLRLYTKEEDSLLTLCQGLYHFPEGRAGLGMQQGGPFPIWSLAKEYLRACRNSSLMPAPGWPKATPPLCLILRGHPFLSPRTPPLHSSKEDRWFCTNIYRSRAVILAKGTGGRAFYHP